MEMPDKEQPRSIRFPESLWNAIDQEAKRCKRSAVKQMEAILATYYGLEDVEINKELLESLKGGNNPIANEPKENNPKFAQMKTYVDGDIQADDLPSVKRKIK